MSASTTPDTARASSWQHNQLTSKEPHPSQIAQMREWLTMNNSMSNSRFALLRPFALVRDEAVSDQIQDPRRVRRCVVDPLFSSVTGPAPPRRSFTAGGRRGPPVSGSLRRDTENAPAKGPSPAAAPSHIDGPPDCPVREGCSDRKGQSIRTAHQATHLITEPHRESEQRFAADRGTRERRRGGREGLPARSTAWTPAAMSWAVSASIAMCGGAACGGRPGPRAWAGPAGCRPCQLSFLRYS
jgi:hypothetical protein